MRNVAKICNFYLFFFWLIKLKKKLNFSSDDEGDASEEERSSSGRESVSITEMEACLENGNAFNRSVQETCPIILYKKLKAKSSRDSTFN
jgi:hypothetical protein